MLHDSGVLSRRELMAAAAMASLMGGGAGLVAAAEPEAEPRIAVKFGKLWDGARVVKDAVVVLEKDRVVGVLEGEAAPRGARVFDLSRYYGLPGLIDLHTHMTYWYDAETKKSPLKQPALLPAVNVFLAQENARKTLETGVTTVRDLSSDDFSDIAMRDLIRRGAMPGPRMFVSGHGLAIRPKVETEKYRGYARGAEEVRRVVKEQVEAGADWIKVFGSTGSYEDVTGDQTFSEDEMKVAVETARAHGKKTAIHSYGPAGARSAVRAGADSLEHGADLDDETLREMAKKKVVWVPTIDHNRYYADNAKLFGFPDKAVRNLRDYIERNLLAARRAHKAGVIFGMGSDAVFTMFGENTRELAWLVDAGLTPEQALQAATTTPAALLGMPKELGLVAKGSFADLVAVEGDPLKDVQVVIRKLRWVMKGGHVVVDRTKK